MNVGLQSNSSQVSNRLDRLITSGEKPVYVSSMIHKQAELVNF